MKLICLTMETIINVVSNVLSFNKLETSSETQNRCQIEIRGCSQNLSLRIIYIIKSEIVFVVCSSRTIFGEKKVSTCIWKGGNMVTGIQG